MTKNLNKIFSRNELVSNNIAKYNSDNEKAISVKTQRVSEKRVEASLNLSVKKSGLDYMGS